ncbi:hypothetical protein [Nitrosomonas sp. wSCUT-2]
MKRIEATLPTLGSYVIPFYDESKEVLEFLSDNELSRLDRVPHLGITAKVFTGVNHSRLEYLLLQCAVINLLPKFHRGKEGYALSGKVFVPKLSNKISSGEELLKCWALLSNAGHAQYTFGVEKSLLNHARDNQIFRNVLVSSIPSKLKKWTQNVIDNYEDDNFHWILSFHKVLRLPPRSRLKSKLFRILEALLLPIQELEIKNSSDRYKIYRLRSLFSRIRLISIVALDAYYSHHPIRYQIPGVLMDLDSLMQGTNEKTEFLRLLEQTASWLADEIYLHPRSVAAQKLYEVNSKIKLNKKYAPRLSTIDSFNEFFPNLMSNGFGQPKVNELGNLARLTFPDTRLGHILGKDLYEISSTLEKLLSTEGDTYVSVVRNPYSRKIHIDLLYNNFSKGTASISNLCIRTSKWIIRLIEAQIKHRLRNIKFPPNVDKELKNKVLHEFRRKFQDEIIKPTHPALESIFNGLIKYILPEEFVGTVSEAIPQQGVDSIGLKLQLVDGSVHDSITNNLLEIINHNPQKLENDRIHELNVLLNYIKKSKALFLACSIEKFHISKKDGGDNSIKDDWDGVILEIYDEKVTVTIIEAKNTKSDISSATQAFNQLKRTQELVNSKNKITSRRRRLIGGACLTFTL